MRCTHRFVRGVGVVPFLAALLFMGTSGAQARDADAKAAELWLPRVASLGRLPDPALTVAVEVDAEGAITIDGVGPLSFDALRQTLARRTSKPWHRATDGTSNRILLVDADRRLPWRMVQWVMQAAAHPSVQMVTIFLGARDTFTGRRGALGFTLPKDRSGRHIEVPTVKVTLQAAPRGATEQVPVPARALGAWLAAREAAERTDAVYEIKAPPPLGADVPVGTVLEVLEMLVRHGVAAVRFEGAPLPPDWEGRTAPIAATVAAHRAREVVPFLRIGGEVPAVAPDAVLPEPRGRIEALLGFEGAAGAENFFSVPERARPATENEDEEVVEEVVEEEEIRAPAPSGSAGGGGAPDR